MLQFRAEIVDKYHLTLTELGVLLSFEDLEEYPTVWVKDDNDPAGAGWEYRVFDPDYWFNNTTWLKLEIMEFADILKSLIDKGFFTINPIIADGEIVHTVAYTSAYLELVGRDYV